MCIVDCTPVYPKNADEDSSFVNCSNIGVGLEVKNYKAMCKLLGESEKTSDSKKAQIKKWERYFDYEKIGQKYLITEVYDEPLPKTDGRISGNNSVYVKYIELLLMHFLSHQHGYEYTFRKNQLYLQLYMVNANYNQRDEMKQMFVNEGSLSKFELDDFYRRVSPKLDRILFSALNNLKQRFLIEYFEEYVIVEKEDKEEIHRVANTNEIKKIIAVNNIILESMGFKSINQVFFRFLSDRYYNSVNQMLFEKYGWSYVYKQYRIIFVKDNIINVIPKSTLELQGMEFNSKIVDVINSQAEKLFSKNRGDIDKEKERLQISDVEQQDGWNLFAIENNEFKMFRLPDNYVENQLTLTDSLIKR